MRFTLRFPGIPSASGALRPALAMMTLLLALAGAPSLAFADPSAQAYPEFDGGQTAWLVLASVLVMFMTVGLAIFYGGLVRRKNVLSTMMHSFMALAIVTITWIGLGYSMAFGPSIGGVIGNPSTHLMLRGMIGPNGPVAGNYASGTPLLIWMMFQMMFAIITPAVISGAYAERITFKGYALFTALWSILVYAPMAHWIWNPEGWLFKLGALDFAGGTVVEIGSGAAALAAALVLGPRKGFKREAFMPHNMPLMALGAGILWFGWYGFNAGGAVNSGGAPQGAAYAGVSVWSVTATAFTGTHIAGAAAILGWCAVELFKHGKVTLLGAASGLIGGLVAITPAAGYVGPIGALVIGLVAGVVCFFAVTIKFKLNYDDALDVVGIHGAGGIVGMILTGVFSEQILNGWGADGLWFGGVRLFLNQLLAAGVAIGYSFGLSYLLLKLIDKTVGLRVDAESEQQGVDLAEHSEQAYTL